MVRPILVNTQAKACCVVDECAQIKDKATCDKTKDPTKDDSGCAWWAPKNACYRSVLGDVQTHTRIDAVPFVMSLPHSCGRLRRPLRGCCWRQALADPCPGVSVPAGLPVALVAQPFL